MERCNSGSEVGKILKPSVSLIATQIIEEAR